MEKINRSAFFLVAVLLHLIVFLMVATWVVWNAKPVASDKPEVFVGVRPPATHEVTASSQTDAALPNVLSGSELGPKAGDAPSTIPSHSSFPIPNGSGATGDTSGHAPRVALPKAPTTDPLKDRVEKIRHTVLNWRPLDDLADTIDHPEDVKTKPFPIYLASYADGDWSCNNFRANDVVKAGSLPNLAAMMKEWTKGRLVTGEIKAIKVSDPELISNPPPFIFFTGHKDFHLTEAEIENLQKYIQAGGCIWGDSAFSGEGSRFDVAFHREMQLVLPDKDARFHPLDLTHPIFAHSKYRIESLASGMNYRKDPIEVINLSGRIAVIYTPNDYSDMMTMLLRTDTEQPTVDTTMQSPTHPLFTPPGFMNSRSVYFRNYEPESARDVYRLSTNIVVHLLTRFDDILLTPP